MTITPLDGILDDILQEQITYYRARAGEYDQWFLRQGRYDRGADANARWFAEAGEVAAALDEFGPTGRVLELACGTGIWTRQLARFAETLTAVDASPEVIAINQGQIEGEVKYVEADLLNWTPDGHYDVVFFGFWLSHVPLERFDSFWIMVRNSLAPGGRVFFVDNRYDPTSTAANHALEGVDGVAVTRRLNNGQEFRIVKVFYEPDVLAEKLAALGWRFDISASASYFLYGSGVRADEA